MNKESLKYVISQFTDRRLPKVLPRELQIPLDSSKVISLIGVRRCGKTYLLFEAVQRLTASGVDRRQILYLNFEDDRLYPVAAKELDLILAAHGELYPDILGKPRYLFLDEVQAVPGWERYVRRLCDTEQVGIFLTGSSSHVLQRELAPAMRGRSITFEVFPLSFNEYLAFRQFAPRPYHRDDEARLSAELNNYLIWGGLPELVLADDSIRRMILEEYASLIFFKDLVERHKIRNERAMRLLLKHCCSHPGSLLSVHKLYADLSSQGLELAKNTLYEYVDALEDALVLFSVPIFDRSTRRQSHNPRKIHLIDPALTTAFAAKPDMDLGHRLENVVFLHERRASRELYYYKNTHEVDLLVNAPRRKRAIQVAWNLDDADTLRRETEAMDFSARQFPGFSPQLICGAISTIDPPDDRIVRAIDYLRSTPIRFPDDP